MKFDDLSKLYAHKLKDLWSAEKQLADMLPRLQKEADDEELIELFNRHTKQSKKRIERLNQVIQKTSFGAQGHRCRGMEGLLQEGKDLLQEDGEPEVIDAGLIAAMNQVMHYLVAGYGTVYSYARKLGEQDQAGILTTSLEEVGQTDRELTRLAEAHINFEAMETA